MNPGRRPRRFCAFVHPHGVCLVEYTRAPEGLHVVERQVESRRFASPTDAAESLARTMRLGPGEGAHLAVAIRGFGSEYLILSLPPADDEVLRPIVGRELARVYPHLEHPVYEFARGGDIDRRLRARPEQAGQPRQELLVGAVPGEAARALCDALRAQGISLDHMTVLPQALQQLYAEIDNGPGPTGVVVMLSGGLLIGFFHDAQLRFVIEPPWSADATSDEARASVLEQLERGKLYLRQTFRGAEMERVLVSADASRDPDLMPSLAASLGIDVREFGSDVGAPDPLIALGAVRDAEAASLINLSPLAVSRVVGARRAKERTLRIAADILIALAMLWAASSVWTLRQLSRRVATSVAEVQRGAGALPTMRSVAEARRDYIRQAASLDSVAADRAGVARVLTAIAATTRSDVQLEELTLARNGATWGADVVAVSTGPSTASALVGVDRFYRSLPSTLTLANRQLVDVAYVVPPSPGRTALRFHVTFSFNPTTALQ